MAWLSASFKQREAITIDNTSAAASVDVEITIPSEWDEFWSVIDASGAELRVTHADGVTVLDYAVDDGSGGPVDRSARLGRIRIDGLACEATASLVLAWVYFDPTSTQGDASTSVTISSAVAGVIASGRPTRWAAVHQPQNPGATTPRVVLTKSATEEGYLWIRLDLALSQSFERIGGRSLLEEAWHVTPSVRAGGGDEATTTYTANKWRFRWHLGQTWLVAHIKGGDDGAAYTVAPTVATVLPGASASHQVLVPRIGMRVAGVLAT